MNSISYEDFKFIKFLIYMDFLLLSVVQPIIKENSWFHENLTLDFSRLKNLPVQSFNRLDSVGQRASAQLQANESVIEVLKSF